MTEEEAINDSNSDGMDTYSSDPRYMQAPFTLMTGHRVDSQHLYILDEKQVYFRNAASRYSVYYLCRAAGCRVRVVLTNNDICYRLKDAKHSHTTTGEPFYLKCMALNDLKRNMALQKNKPLRTIFEETMRKHPGAVVNFKDHVRTFQSIHNGSAGDAYGRDLFIGFRPRFRSSF